MHPGPHVGKPKRSVSPYQVHELPGPAATGTYIPANSSKTPCQQAPSALSGHRESWSMTGAARLRNVPAIHASPFSWHIQSQVFLPPWPHDPIFQESVPSKRSCPARKSRDPIVPVVPCFARPRVSSPKAILDIVSQSPRVARYPLWWDNTKQLTTFAGTT